MGTQYLIRIRQLTFFITILCLFAADRLAFSKDQENTSTYVVGQDTESIDDFFTALRNLSSIENIHYPDGVMAYTSINDLRGLFDSVDHGAGVNYTNELFQKYPQIRVAQIGLYMRYMLKEVVQGGLDQNIDKLGQWIKGSGRSVYLRIGYEFDNPANEYDPQAYIQAYRHIVDRLRNMDVQNVYFVWHTIAWKDKDWPAYDPLKWYPGDEYVDWMGISFFDADQEQERNTITSIARIRHKPLMIAESSPFKQYTIDGKLKWMEKLFQYIRDNHVTFLSYVNVNWDGLSLFVKEKWGDARLQNDPALMKGWLSEIGQFRTHDVHPL